MSDFLPTDTISQDDLFNLDLIRKDLVSDLLFLVGTMLGISINLKAGQEIVCSESNETTCGNEADKSSSGTEPVIVVIALFLAATSILAYTAYARLDRQISELDKEPDITVLKNISGSKLNIIGLLFRITGYILSITGNQIKADNPV